MSESNCMLCTHFGDDVYHHPECQHYENTIPSENICLRCTVFQDENGKLVSDCRCFEKLIEDFVVVENINTESNNWSNWLTNSVYSLIGTR